MTGTSHVFGPVPSRRLGLSLGIDLIPFKTCTYDCIYCQVGRTIRKTTKCEEFFSPEQILEEIKEKLSNISPDFITFSGSGEPTLYSKIDELTRKIKRITDIKIALLTNGSLFWKDEIRERVLEIDLILPTLTTANEDTFRRIHRPHPELRLNNIIDGLIKLRKEYKGKIFLELFVLKGINDNEKELIPLRDVIKRIKPDKIQINTVVRPPSEKDAIAVDMDKLEEIASFFGKNAEVIAYRRRISKGVKGDKISHIVEMIKRRPVSAKDISDAMGIDIDEVHSIIKGLMIKGIISFYDHLNETYYILREGKR